MVEIRAARLDRDRLLAGVDQVAVFLAGGRCLAHAEQAVLAVQQDLTVGRQVIADQGGQADAEIDHGTIGNVFGHAGGHLIAGQALHILDLLGAQAAAWLAPSTLTTRLTNNPGVTMCSGSSSPSSTISLTCTMGHLAAIAMIGPKLRAVLR